MSEINNHNDLKIADYRVRDYSSYKNRMKELIREKLPEWTDTTEADFGIALIDIFAHTADILSYYQDRLVNESFLSTARERRSILHHLRLIGYELQEASAASAMLSLEFVLKDDWVDPIKISYGDQFSTAATKEEPVVLFEYVNEEPIIIYPNNIIPDKGKRKYKSCEKLKNDEKAPEIPVKEGQTIKDEILGISDGSSNQVFKLAHPKLLRDSLYVKIKHARIREEKWDLREFLFYSDPGDKHYICRVDENNIAHIHFGNNKMGRIPLNGSEVIATYRVGGGNHGNVGAGQINVISNAQQLTLLAAKVTNKQNATGGSEREDEQHAINNAPSVFKSLHRAVTKEDIECLALKYNGIIKAKAISTNWNTINLYVVPEGFGPASDVLRKDLKLYFEDKRMVSTIINVNNPSYVKISITAEVDIAPFYFNDVIRNKIHSALRDDVLHHKKVNFEQPVYLSKVYEAIENIEGVENVFVSGFLTDHEEQLTPDSMNYDMDKAIAKNGMIELKELEFPLYDPEYIHIIIKGGK